MIPSFKKLNRIDNNSHKSLSDSVYHSNSHNGESSTVVWGSTFESLDKLQEPESEAATHSIYNSFYKSAFDFPDLSSLMDNVQEVAASSGASPLCDSSYSLISFNNREIISTEKTSRNLHLTSFAPLQLVEEHLQVRSLHNETHGTTGLTRSRMSINNDSDDARNSLTPISGTDNKTITFSMEETYKKNINNTINGNNKVTPLMVDCLFVIPAIIRKTMSTPLTTPTQQQQQQQLEEEKCALSDTVVSPNFSIGVNEVKSTRAENLRIIKSNSCSGLAPLVYITNNTTVLQDPPPPPPPLPQDQSVLERNNTFEYQRHQRQQQKQQKQQCPSQNTSSGFFGSQGLSMPFKGSLGEYDKRYNYVYNNNNNNNSKNNINSNNRKNNSSSNNNGYSLMTLQNREKIIIGHIKPGQSQMMPFQNSQEHQQPRILEIDKSVRSGGSLNQFSLSMSRSMINVHSNLQDFLRYIPYIVRTTTTTTTRKTNESPSIYPELGSTSPTYRGATSCRRWPLNNPKCDCSTIQLLPIFIQMFPCELRDRTIIVLNRVIEATCGPDIATVVGVEPRSETSFITHIRTGKLWELIYRLRCRVLMDRHGFWYAENMEQYVRLKEYCEGVRRLPQQMRHYQTDGLPCMPLVVELARSLNAAEVLSPPADRPFDEVVPIATVERHRVKSRPR